MSPTGLGVTFCLAHTDLCLANGAVERFNQTIKRAIRQAQTKWNDKKFVDIHGNHFIMLTQVGDLMRNYNNTIHSAHGLTPYQVFFGDEATRALADERMEKYRAKKILRVGNQEALPIGTSVRLSSRENPSVRKKLIGLHKSPRTNFEPEIHEVTKILHSHIGYPDRYQVSGSSKLYTRSDILPIPKNTDNTIAQRPVFTNLHKPSTQKRKVEYVVEPIPEFRQPSKRQKKFNSLFNDFV